MPLLTLNNISFNACILKSCTLNHYHTYLWITTLYFLTLQSCFFVQICSGLLNSTFRDSVNLKSVSSSWYQILHSIYCCHFHIYDAFICETFIVRLSPSVLHLSNQTKPVWTVLKHENFDSQHVENVTKQLLFPQIMH